MPFVSKEFTINRTTCVLNMATCKPIWIIFFKDLDFILTQQIDSLIGFYKCGPSCGWQKCSLWTTCVLYAVFRTQRVLEFQM